MPDCNYVDALVNFLSVLMAYINELSEMYYKIYTYAAENL